jgi:hypothetical protein
MMLSISKLKHFHHPLFIQGSQWVNSNSLSFLPFMPAETASHQRD